MFNTSWGIYSIPKASKYTADILSINNKTQCVPLLFLSSRFMTNFLNLFQSVLNCRILAYQTYQIFYEKTICFYYNFRKLISRSIKLHSFNMFNFLVLKWYLFQINAEFVKNNLSCWGEQNSLFVSETYYCCVLFKSDDVLVNMLNPWLILFITG